ncbi:MAG: hypothetical protein R3360_06240 [Alphaproteobacteria bacterium]|nr:hypothetical protein [Alphaproteobacteria bacterium]
MKPFFSVRWIASALVILMLVTSPGAYAHEGHQDDMSDEEMILMEMGGAEHSDMMGDGGMTGDHGTTARPGDEHMMADGEMPQELDRASAAEKAMQAAIAENRATSGGDFLGRLHPFAAHFPVGLLLAAVIAEIMLMVWPTLGMGLVVRFLVAGGAIGATLAAVLGWFAAGWRLTDRSETLGFHRWNGTGIAAASLVATWFAFRSKDRVWLRIMLAMIAIATLSQGYLGGEMVLGPNHLGIR